MIKTLNTKYTKIFTKAANGRLYPDLFFKFTHYRQKKILDKYNKRVQNQAIRCMTQRILYETNSMSRSFFSKFNVFGTASRVKSNSLNVLHVPKSAGTSRDKKARGVSRK